MTDAKAMTNFMKALDELRDLDHKMTIQTASVFAVIAANNGEVSAKVIADTLGMAQSTASRTCIALTKWKNEWKKEPGYDLAEMVTDLADRRRKNIKLNRKGIKLAERISDRL